MGRLSKEQKQKFADAFMICRNGKKAMESAGIEWDIKTMQSLLLDKKLTEYIDKNIETVQYMLGRTKDGHLAKLEKLFDQATGMKKSKITSFTKDGHYVECEGYYTDYKGASMLSKRIGELQDWETTDGNNQIEIDLKISDELFKSDEEAQQSERSSNDEKVLNHLKAEGVL